MAVEALVDLVELPALARPEERALGERRHLAREGLCQQLPIRAADLGVARPGGVELGPKRSANASSCFSAERERARAPASGEAGSRKTSWYS